MLLSQASSLLPAALLGGVSGAGSAGRGTVASSSDLGYDLRLRLRPVATAGRFLGASSAVASPWLFGRLLRRRSRISLSRGDVTLLSSYSTVTIFLGSSLRDVSDLRAGLWWKGAISSAEREARGEVCARRLRRTLTISVLSFSGGGEVGASALSSLLGSFPLPDPLLVGRCSFSELDGFDGLRGRCAGRFCPVLLPTYETSGSNGLSGGVFGVVGFSSSVAGLSFLTIFEGRTQALGIVLGAGRALSFGGDCLLRQCESLMTRFFGAVAVSKSSSRTLWATGVFFALLGRSGLASTDFFGVCFGVQSGFSSNGFALGVACGFGEGAGLLTLLLLLLSDADAPGFAAPTTSGSTSCCHLLILSRTLAGLFMPIAFAKSFPFMLVCLSVAPVFLPGVPFFFNAAVSSASLGSGEAGIESCGHWSSPGASWCRAVFDSGFCCCGPFGVRRAVATAERPRSRSASADVGDGSRVVASECIGEGQ